MPLTDGHTAVLERLSNVARGPARTGGRLLAFLEAYFDESVDGKSELFFTMAGFVGFAESWNCLWGAWDRCLRKHKLKEFKAANCMARDRDFGPEKRKAFECDAIYQDFFDIIMNPAINQGLAAHAGTISITEYSVDFPDWRAEEQNTGAGKNHPYYVAFRHCIEPLCLLPPVSTLPAEYKVSFVFDNNDKVRVAARSQYLSMLDTENLPYAHRLDPVCMFGDSVALKSLQAADLIAWEYNRARIDLAAQNILRPQFLALVQRWGLGWDWPGDDASVRQWQPRVSLPFASLPASP